MAQKTEVVLEQATKTRTSITCEQSQKLIQTMLTMSFGCVAFLRGLFPDDNFVDQRFVPNKFEPGYDPKDPTCKNDSIRVKTLTRGKSSRADLFLDWIDKGATDAIRKGYLKSLSFSVFLDRNDPTNLQEVYTFFFDYKNDDVRLSINDQENEQINLLDSRKMMQRLMKRFIIITQSLEPLPEEKYISMRMLFNDKCPKDYQPPYFKDASSEPSVFLKAPKNTTVDEYSAGSINTSFHNIQLKVLSRPVLISNEDEIIEIDPFEVSQSRAPSMIKNPAPLKSRNQVFKRELSPTTNKLLEFLRSPQPEFKQTQAIPHVKCECGSLEELDVSGIIKCASCEGTLHGSCYASSSRRQSTTCFTCRSNAMSGIKTHQNLRLLFISRKLYRLFTKCDIPLSTKIIRDQLGFSTRESINLIASVLSFFFKKCILLMENEPRKLKRQVGDSAYQKGSSYVDVDIEGINVNGRQLPKGRYVWSFVPKIYGPDLTAWKSSAARAKKFLFEDTLESGLAIDVSEAETMFKLVNINIFRKI